MRAFRFPFARVLRVRRLQEAAHRAAFLEARALAERAADTAREQAEVLGAAREALRGLQSSARLSPLEVLRQHESVERYEEAVERSRRAARARSAEADELRGTWQELRSGVRGLERLEELRRSAHAKERERVEARAADERALAVEGSSGIGSKRRTDSGRPGPVGSRFGGFRTEDRFDPLPAPHRLPAEGTGESGAPS